MATSKPCIIAVDYHVAQQVVEYITYYIFNQVWCSTVFPCVTRNAFIDIFATSIYFSTHFMCYFPFLPMQAKCIWNLWVSTSLLNEKKTSWAYSFSMPHEVALHKSKQLGISNSMQFVTKMDEKIGKWFAIRAICIHHILLCDRIWYINIASNQIIKQ